MSLYSVRQRKSSHAPTSSVPHWWTETPKGSSLGQQEVVQTYRKHPSISKRILRFYQVKKPRVRNNRGGYRVKHLQRRSSPGSDRVVQLSLFLLFLSFLNFGTRRNLALRLRFEKSVRGPWGQSDRINSQLVDEHIYRSHDFISSLSSSRVTAGSCEVKLSGPAIWEFCRNRSPTPSYFTSWSEGSMTGHNQGTSVSRRSCWVTEPRAAFSCSCWGGSNCCTDTELLELGPELVPSHEKLTEKTQYSSEKNKRSEYWTKRIILFQDLNKVYQCRVRIM